MITQSSDRTVLREAVLHEPRLVEQLMELPDRCRIPRALVLAIAVNPDATPSWLDLMRAAVTRQPSFRFTTNGIDQRYLIAFKTPDCPDAREVWNLLLDDVENDAELLQLVVAAMQGHGIEWIATCACLDPASIPHQQLRAATIAAMIAIGSEHTAIIAASQSHGGWIARGFERAIALCSSDRLAQAWYRRFRSAQNWYEAWGSWHMHCQWIDTRQHLWDKSTFPLHALPDAARFERDSTREVKNAIEEHNKRLTKTRLGIAL